MLWCWLGDRLAGAPSAISELFAVPKTSHPLRLAALFMQYRGMVAAERREYSSGELVLGKCGAARTGHQFFGARRLDTSSTDILFGRAR
jgi:hypothetical protein